MLWTFNCPSHPVPKYALAIVFLKRTQELPPMRVAQSGDKLFV
jgi:hypothetical protein